MANTVDQLIIELRQKLHITSVVVTHHMPSVYNIADRVGTAESLVDACKALKSEGYGFQIELKYRVHCAGLSIGEKPTSLSRAEGDVHAFGNPHIHTSPLNGKIIAENICTGLKKIEDANVGVAYIDPNADFSVYKRVAISDPYVAFRANWRRDTNRSRMRPVTATQMEKIKSDVASLLKEVLTERLEADDGYEVTNEADYDVLLVKPAIVE